MLREYGQQLQLDMNASAKDNLKQIQGVLDNLALLARKYRKEHGKYPRMEPPDIRTHRHMCVGDYDHYLRLTLDRCEFAPDNPEITSILDCPYRDVLEVNIVAIFDTDEPLDLRLVLTEGVDLWQNPPIPVLVERPEFD